MKYVIEFRYHYDQDWCWLDVGAWALGSYRTEKQIDGRKMTILDKCAVDAVLQRLSHGFVRVRQLP